MTSDLQTSLGVAWELHLRAHGSASDLQWFTTGDLPKHPSLASTTFCYKKTKILPCWHPRPQLYTSNTVPSARWLSRYSNKSGFDSWQGQDMFSVISTLYLGPQEFLYHGCWKLSLWWFSGRGVKLVSIPPSSEIKTHGALSPFSDIFKNLSYII